MKRHLNLMTDAAQFRVAARISLRHWAVALAVGTTLLAPLSIWHWQECRRVRQQHEALEAGYEPFRRLAVMNTELRTTASSLVHDERLALELARHRPVASLLGVVSAAVHATDEALFIEHLSLTQTPPAGDPAVTAAQDRLIIEAVCTPQFDISTFTDALKRKPIYDVKITADDLVTENGVDAKNYTIECSLTGPAIPQATKVN